MTNTTTVSPVPIPTVVPLPRMSYDVPYNPNYPNNTPHYPTPQLYSPNPGNYHPDIYGNTPHNIVLANGGQFYPTQPDYASTAPVNHQSMEFARRPNWDQVVSGCDSLRFWDINLNTLQINKPQNNIQQLSKNRGLTSLAELHQRKQEVISQLEKVVGKNAAITISNTATNLARQDSYDSDSPFSFWPQNSGPTFVRSDSILKDDDYVPYDAPCVSKYGPISRMHKENASTNQNVQNQYRDSNIPASMV